MKPIKEIQATWTNYGHNYDLKVYKTHIEVVKYFTNGWQNSNFQVRRCKIADFEAKYGKIKDTTNPEWVFEVALNR